MIYIDTNQALADVAKHWLTLERIALDSEFMRVDTFYPKLALIQINDGDNTYLIDPLAITDWQPLQAVFTCQTVVKLLHSPSEDFDAFFHNLDVLPEPMMDTQLAASMASMGGIMGYQKLVKALLDVDLEKGETRSDWLKRPLSDKQLHYAADDVEYLLSMMNTLEARLKEQGRWQWFLADCAQVLEDWRETQKSGYSHERIKKAWMLKGHQLNVLKQLVSWREQRCKEVNIPRGHLINDALLMELAMRLPQSTKQLSSIKGLRPATLRKEGEQIVLLIQSCKDTPKEQWPERMERPLSQSAGEWFKKMRRKVDKIAEQLDVPPELLARKKPMEAMLREGYPNGPFSIPQTLQGWREEVVGTPLLNVLNQLSKQS
ncbi:ribonuclease D [Oceaniserpentilla sp. 4NH20-0058]|uniref:ribonuclease D n=1 Tax=Oceaniserpentilla sp. 4NH20-0058 TaxID=3127660 RepID=UPI0031036077